MAASAPMFALLRTLAPAVLLVASFSGHVAPGLVLAHVAVDHAATPAHDHHGDETPSGHHHGDADHGDADHGAANHGDADSGEGHSHELTLASATLARTVNASLALHAPPAVLQCMVALPRSHALQRSTPRLRPLEPPAPQRHSILLI